MAEAADAKRYEGFEGFLQDSIHAYYKRSFRSHKGTFVALIISSGQILSLVKEKLSGPAEETAKKAAIGAGLLIALRIGLGFALSGPLGILLTAGAGASLIWYATKNQEEITAKHSRVRALVDETRRRYEEVHGGYGGEPLDDSRRRLMVDGLFHRFLDDLDAV